MSGNQSAKAARQAARAKELEEKKAMVLAYKTKSREQSQGKLDLKKIDNLEDFLTKLNDLVPSDQRKDISHSSPAAIPSKASSQPTVESPKQQPKQPQVQQQATQHEQPPVKSNDLPEPTKKHTTLSIQQSVLFDFAPREVAVYTKATQTVETAIQTEPTANEQTVTHSESSMLKKKLDGTQEQATEKQPEEVKKEPVELSSAEKQKVIESPPFLEFLEKTSKVVERALFVSSKYDILKDYSKSEDVQEKANTTEVRLQIKLFDERWSKHRAVMDLGWSSMHNELVLASYSANESGTNDPDGVVLVWSVQNTLERPEYRFNCQSPVMTAFFSEFSATTVIGGTYSGQIVFWDLRAKSSPVQSTPLTAVGHTHPIYSMKMVGTKNAHNLVSVSTDGKLCVWSLENLLLPQEVLVIQSQTTKPALSAPIAVTALSFPVNEANNFFIGSEEGAIYQAFRHGKTGVVERYEGHFGPITGLDFHSAIGPVDFSDLFISSSTDWSCKLWSSKTTKPIYSFEDAGDYVYDVKWCPTNPSVFGSVDGSGILDLWNLNQDTEAPTLKTHVSSKALSRLAWARDGKRILTGDSAGYLYLYDTGQLGNANAEEWRKMEQTLSKLKMSQQEEPAST
jgi:dynein intermediate chain